MRTWVTAQAIRTSSCENVTQFERSLFDGTRSYGLLGDSRFEGVASNLGGSLVNFDTKAALQRLSERVKSSGSEKIQTLFQRFQKNFRRQRWSTRVSLLSAFELALDLGAFEDSVGLEASAVVVAGHNFHMGSFYQSVAEFHQDRDTFDPTLLPAAYDTNEASSIAEALQIGGPTLTVGGACASGNLALQNAQALIKLSGMDRVWVVGGIYDFSPLEYQFLSQRGAIPDGQFTQEQAKQMSRPFDQNRKGFVPSHATAVMVIESDRLKNRLNRKPLAELIAVGSSNDTLNTLRPYAEGHERAYAALFKATEVSKERVDLISAHATGTAIGDDIELEGLERFFGEHARNVALNAPKSIVGHTLCAASLVEAIAGIIQMRRSEVHPCYNLDHAERETPFDLIQGGPSRKSIRYFMNSSFGFGGINSVSLFGNPEMVDRP